MPTQDIVKAVALECHEACDQLARDYLTFLYESQGVTRVTLRSRRRIIGGFIQCGLEHRCAPDQIRELHPSTIHDYVIANAGASRSTRKQIVSGLRSFLKFLHIWGHIGKPLIDAVPIIHIPHDERVPRGLPWPEIEHLLTMPDRSTESGRRGYAILSLLAAYGIRIGQALHLKLSDVHWANGIIRFAAQKGGKPLCFPLTASIAEALFSYLRDRGRAEYDELFLSVTTPHRPLTRDYIPSDEIARYYQQAGLKAKGSHTIRHSFATRLIQEGMPIKTIADLLGHGCINTTFVYTKVNVEQLRKLSSEWPIAVQEGK